MKVLRDNKESLMAVLEAFVYDPLINWRLMQTEVDARRPDGECRNDLSVLSFFSQRMKMRTLYERQSSLAYLPILKLRPVN
jgi:phosphatidylinositol kinase/protein kinase (PI-3  family)